MKRFFLFFLILFLSQPIFAQEPASDQHELTLQQIGKAMALGSAQEADRQIRQVLGKLKNFIDQKSPAISEKTGGRP